MTVPSPERPQLPLPGRTWPHLASSTASSPTSTADCLITLPPYSSCALSHHAQNSMPLGDEKGGPVGISKSPLSTFRHQRAPPPQLAYLSRACSTHPAVPVWTIAFSLPIPSAPSLAVSRPCLPLPVPSCVPCRHVRSSVLCRQTSSRRPYRPLREHDGGHVRLYFLPISPDDSEK